jgi:hypothetical protein
MLQMEPMLVVALSFGATVAVVFAVGFISPLRRICNDGAGGRFGHRRLTTRLRCLRRQNFQGT